MNSNIYVLTQFCELFCVYCIVDTNQVNLASYDLFKCEILRDRLVTMSHNSAYVFFQVRTSQTHPQIPNDNTHSSLSSALHHCWFVTCRRWVWEFWGWWGWRDIGAIPLSLSNIEHEQHQSGWVSCLNTCDLGCQFRQYIPRNAQLDLLNIDFHKCMPILFSEASLVQGTLFDHTHKLATNYA